MFITLSILVTGIKINYSFLKLFLKYILLICIEIETYFRLTRIAAAKNFI